MYGTSFLYSFVTVAESIVVAIDSYLNISIVHNNLKRTYYFPNLAIDRPIAENY